MVLIFRKFSINHGGAFGNLSVPQQWQDTQVGFD
jgi:hypothetical protein